MKKVIVNTGLCVDDRYVCDGDLEIYGGHRTSRLILRRVTRGGSTLKLA